jgi:outer membrane protein
MDCTALSWLTAEQKLFNGHQTVNRTRAAESNVLVARETLRVIEQTVLLDAATIYMDVCATPPS